MGRAGERLPRGLENHPSAPSRLTTADTIQYMCDNGCQLEMRDESDAESKSENDNDNENESGADDDEV